MRSSRAAGDSLSRSTGRLSRISHSVRLLQVLVLALAVANVVQFTAFRGRSEQSAAPGVARSGVPTPKASSAAGGGVTLQEPDGGSHFYAKFQSSLPDDPTFFPIGVWLESVVDPPDVAKDKAAALNTYVALVPGSNFNLAAQGGMHVLGQADLWSGPEHRKSPVLKGWVLPDEIDMFKGPVEGVRELKSVRQKIPAGDRRLVYGNYGKGVLFWETDEEASTFVNNFQDIVSTDAYWFTDLSLCQPSQGGQLVALGEQLSPTKCQLAANYGRTVDRVRALVTPDGSKPVWHFVEVGHPSSEENWPSITPAQIRAAVWSGLIHGARGVVYFNHSFGGPAASQHALREPAYAATTAMVTRVNRQITELAPVLNARTALGILDGAKPLATRGVTTTSGVVGVGSTDVLVKRHDDHFYLLAGSATNAAHDTTFSASCVGDASVTVIGEGRTLAMKNGQFKDTFADGNAVHIYRIDGGSSCGLPAS